jgi:hypothetical protein
MLDDRTPPRRKLTTRCVVAGAIFAAGSIVSACGGIAVLPADGGEGGATAGSSSSSQASTSTGEPICDPALHTISPADYDLTCDDDSDCVAVFLGDLCQGCFCKFGAINVADEAKHDADLAAKSKGVPTTSTCGCPFLPVACDGGQCTVH